MRNLSANALAQIAIKLGNEPVTIIEVDWVQDVTGSQYADRDVGSIPGRILEVSDLDNVINVSENDSSQEISLVLDDNHQNDPRHLRHSQKERPCLSVV